MEPRVEKIYKMCVPDEHFERIQELLKESPDNEIHVKHKDGYVVRFYYTAGVLYADKQTEDDSIFTQEVIKMSDVQKVKMETSEFRAEMLSRISKDSPDLPEESKEAMADILYEANESIKKLIASGVHPGVAKALIEAVLNDKEIIDGTGGSAEALAEVLRNREEMFGKPSDPGYGEDIPLKKYVEESPEENESC